MKAGELQRTIIRDIRAYIDYPFERIEKNAQIIFEWGIDRLTNAHRKRAASLIRAFESFLQISNQRVSAQRLSDPGVKSACKEFLGALNSDCFIALSNPSRYHYGSTFSKLLTEMKPRARDCFDADFCISSVGPTDYIKDCVDQFQRLELVEEKVWLWSGWPTTNRSGKTTWLRLYPVYERLGREFTQSLYHVCDNYFSARMADDIVVIDELAKFIREYPHGLHSHYFKDPLFVTRFWRKFLEFYINTKFDANVQISTLIVNWRAHFLYFVKEYLIPSGLFAEPYGELPSPAPRVVPGSCTHIKTTEDGTEVKAKLLTHIPLQVDDTKAMELLFNQIQADYDIIVNWASRETENIWERYQRRCRLAPLGQPRIATAVTGRNNGGNWLTSRDNPDHLKNAAGTLLHYGYVTRHNSALTIIFPQPLKKTAYELALPISGALLPHCVLLVANHPKITVSFLEKLELYDKNNKRVGLLKTDSGYVLDGRKDRRGPFKSQQVIELTDLTSKLVLQMIELTSPLRKYLEERGDDNWRYLLLTCKQGFSYPTRVWLTTDTSDPRRQKILADSLGITSRLSYKERLEYSRRFSLTALRASAAVLVFIKERSAKKMAEALGHSEYSAGLLSRYLPEPVLAFFQERWIRIFQMGIIVEAMKDSEYVLEASSFSSMAELDEFFRIHALKTIPKHLESPEHQINNGMNSKQSSGTEVVFGVNTGILTSMLSLQLAVSRAHGQVSGRAKYWAEITKHLVCYLESKQCKREDLKGYLSAAKRQADPTKMEALIYE